MMKTGFGRQGLLRHPDKEIVIAYFNYVDADWSMDNMISEQAGTEILKAL